jgi:hypothetical protein
MATRDLGELGTPGEPVDMDFGWHGERIRVNPEYSDLAFIEFLDQAARIDAGDDTASMRATLAFLRDQIHPEDWARFMELNRAQHQQFRDLFKLAGNIVAAVARFPTGRPSDSSGGRPSTEQRSRAGSSSAVAQAMADSKGRPDLKMIIWQAQEAKLADAA